MCQINVLHTLNLENIMCKYISIKIIQDEMHKY